MNKVNMTYGWLWNCLITGSLLLASCADSYEETPAPQPVPQPEPQLQDESLLVARSFTRTDGAGLVTPSSDSPIYLFACTPTENESKGTFAYSGTGWGSTDFAIKEERQYYFYGFMPANGITGSLSVTDTDLGGDYSKGADLTLTGLPAISTKDICVVVGVERTTESATEATVENGHFGFLSKTKDQNYANLLMDHIYMELDLGFKIDPDYAALRTIRLTEVTLTSSYQGTVTAIVKLRDRDGIRDVSYSRVGNTGVEPQSFTLLSTDDTPKVLNKNYLISDNPADTEPLKLDKTVFCAPNLIDASGTYLTIETKYEVWDKIGANDKSKIGERTAVNKLKLAPSTIAKKRKVTLNVKPTYLYVLSDWDMDYPEIVISNE